MQSYSENIIEMKNNLKNSKKFILKKDNKIKDKELSILCRQMSILLESGCEILKILDILKKQSNKKISLKLEEVSKYIKQGSSITDSFTNTNSFSNFFISMLKAGEASGKLDVAMRNLAQYYDKEYKMKAKIRNASIYPIIVSTLAFLSFIIIMVFVIPNYEMLFEGNGIEPPLITKVLVNTSKFIRTKYIYIIFFTLAMIPTLYYISKISSKVKLDNLKFKLPVINKITKIIITTRFCKSLGLLIKSGVQIVEAIDISSRVINSNYIYEKMSTSIEYIQNGNQVAYSLNASNIFPDMFISMINIGEESGRLDDCLSTSEKFYDNELDTMLDKMMKWIEPLIMIILGIFVCIFMVAMVLPMFDSITAIQ
ncbi:type II secretion system F family protein [Romboutsia lituseburensis]|uniref:type II secretion system F family protein n=1 Tax=Romboutsia lituseburensis TaxID=1537 RepID=UPI00215A9B2B|nr:type II secretion system F family protein [Romboutsia lituseburensis]MCR8746140.1 type II secretion system F family protein [Romboutsia lituseburensis]